MKVLMLNGSSKLGGCTFTALTEFGKALEKQGIGYEIFQTGAKPIMDCTGCGKCGDCSCVYTDDGVNEFLEKAQQADGFVFGTPVYYAHPSGRVLSFLDRAFYCSGSKPFRCKPAVAVASARRAGTTCSIDVLQKYFGISQMITVGSTYWPMVHGNSPEDVMKDEEGLQTMRNAAREMSWLLKCIAAGEEKGIELPVPERTFKTNFIH